MSRTGLEGVWDAVGRRVADGGLVVIAVDGRSGSGKTHFAQRLRTHASAELGVGIGEVGLVAVEELYAGWSGLTAAPALLDWCVLSPLRSGASRVTWPRWDWAAGRYGSTGSLERPRTGLLVVEGVGSSAPPARDGVDHVVWMEAPAPARRQAVRRRESELLGRDGTDSWWPGWAAAEDQLLAEHPPVWDQLVTGAVS
ncbi:hypothetical protein [Kytococcus sedentarius]|uniref:hypothetical protein n=1 Tax=Kytococcus sedentarius TaxID=1276 RepID=UPI0035BC3A34